MEQICGIDVVIGDCYAARVPYTCSILREHIGRVSSIDDRTVTLSDCETYQVMLGCAGGRILEGRVGQLDVQRASIIELSKMGVENKAWLLA